jgi:hypothetical protein
MVFHPLVSGRGTARILGADGVGEVEVDRGWTRRGEDLITGEEHDPVVVSSKVEGLRERRRRVQRDLGRARDRSGDHRAGVAAVGAVRWTPEPGRDDDLLCHRMTVPASARMVKHGRRPLDPMHMNSPRAKREQDANDPESEPERAAQIGAGSQRPDNEVDSNRCGQRRRTGSPKQILGTHCAGAPSAPTSRSRRRNDTVERATSPRLTDGQSTRRPADPKLVAG